MIFLLESHFADSSPTRVKNVDPVNLHPDRPSSTTFLLKLLRDDVGFTDITLLEPTLNRVYLIVNHLVNMINSYSC